MSYSDSSHFSDKLSYKILFILSYGLKDMNFAKFKHLQNFQGKKNREAEIGPDLVGVGNKGPRGARDSSEQIWAKAHPAPDLR
jgi:hypothetical protein